MRSYVQTDSQIASSPQNNAGRGRRDSLPRFVRHARKVVADHLFRSSRKYRAYPQLSVAAVRGEKSVCLAPEEAYACSSCLYPGMCTFVRQHNYRYTNFQRIFLTARRLVRRDDRPCSNRIIKTNGRSFVDH